MRLLVTVALAALLLLGASVPAVAAPPTHEALPPEADPGTIDCATFEDSFVDFFDGTVTTYFNRNGDPVRLVFHVEHHSNDTNSVTGLTIHEHGHFTVTVDLVNETVTMTGSQEVANRPGFGVVVQDVGRVVFDFEDNLLFFAGGTKHSELFGGDQVLCDALA
ncbi:MAG: hypothetical protein E6G41_17030 [Actinobacteria bacterium]|nr:MAG: hypothetical protein E6G41_17030 [Actinomycetota bacterium]